MIARHRGLGTHYYLSRWSGDKREEVPLGNALEVALAEYEALTPGRAKPVEDIEAMSRELFNRAKKGARQRKLEFALTVGHVEALLRAADGRCMLTGIPFDLQRPEGARRRLWAPSIDRIESGAGYVPGNVRVIAVAVNIAMSDFGEEFLVRIAHAILRRQRAQRMELRNIAE